MSFLGLASVVLEPSGIALGVPIYLSLRCSNQIVRAFGKSHEYIDKMFAKIDVYGQCTFYIWLFNRWMGLRMAVMGGIFAILVGAVIVAVPNVDASLAGFALSFALNYTVNVIWTIRRYANTELDMNSKSIYITPKKVDFADRKFQVPNVSLSTLN